MLIGQKDKGGRGSQVHRIGSVQTLTTAEPFGEEIHDAAIKLRSSQDRRPEPRLSADQATSLSIAGDAEGDVER